MTDTKATEYDLKGDYLDSIWSELKPGIISKNATGIGATQLELSDKAQRNSIVVSPLVSILKSKRELRILTFYGGIDDQVKEVDEYLKRHFRYLKIHTTAESLPSLFNILKSFNINPFNGGFHYVLDEYDLMQLQSDFRENLPLAFDYYKEFPKNNRTCVSATHSTFSDPDMKGEAQHNIKFSRKGRNLELYSTDNAIEITRRILSSIPDQVFIFVDSIRWINTLIPDLGTTDIAVYCGKDSVEQVEYYKDYELTPSNRICFFTSAYFVGCDLKLERNPVLITITDPLALNRGLTKAQIFQIPGRLRNGISRDIIVSSFFAHFHKGTLPNKDELISEAEKYKKSFAHVATSQIAVSKKKAIISFLRRKGHQFCLRLNFKNQIVVDYALIDSIITRETDFNDLYFGHEDLKKFLCELKYKVTHVVEITGSRVKLIKHISAEKNKAFNEALKEIQAHSYSLVYGVLDPTGFRKLVRKASGKKRKLLELFSKINDVEIFESSKGDVKKLQKHVDFKITRDLLQVSGIIPQLFKVGARMDIPEMHSLILKAFSLAQIPGKPPAKSKAKEYLRLCCEFEPVWLGPKESRKKAIKITKVLV